MSTGASLSVQFASIARHLPSRPQVRRWALAAHPTKRRAAITIRYVDEDEGRVLNRDFCGRDYATNVLTFVQEADQLALQGLNYAADIVICAPVIDREAREQRKSLASHHGHMVIHGMLHAQGYDHEDKIEAEAMETLEIALLHRFRIKNPYA